MSQRFHLGEMELFDNWGSNGSIHIDGSPFSDGFHDFGHLPSNNRVADGTFREASFAVNAEVTVIEIHVSDITNRSELFVDDLVIIG